MANRVGESLGSSLIFWRISLLGRAGIAEGLKPTIDLRRPLDWLPPSSPVLVAEHGDAPPERLAGGSDRLAVHRR